MAALLQLVVVLLVVMSVTVSGTSEERHSVLIVGAGISGFAAGVTLLSNNVTDFVILEAADRIGGRIHTVEFGGVPVDKGAEFVHGQVDNVVYDLVKPHNLLASYDALIRPEKYIFADVTGRQYNLTLVHSLLDKARDILYGNHTDYQNSDGSVASVFYPKFQEFLEAEGVDSELREAVTHLATIWETSYSAGDSLEQLGMRGGDEYVENGGDLSLKWKSRGYKTIFDILSKKFPNASEEIPIMEKVRYGKEVLKVDYGSGEAVVTCADGSVYRAGHVIITVSLGVLKQRAGEGGMFNPPLPQNKTDAIRTLGIGCVGKVFLLFPTQWLPADKNTIAPLFSKKQLEDFKNTSTYGHWTAYTTGMWPMMQHERMWTFWYSGEACRAVERLGDEEVVEGILELLTALVGKQLQIPRPEAILRTNWGSNPHTLGSYSFCTPESDRLNITRQHLSEPLFHQGKPVVLFAGEATHPHYWSTVHGGLASGVREANSLLQYLRDAA